VYIIQLGGGYLTKKHAVIYTTWYLSSAKSLDKQIAEQVNKYAEAGWTVNSSNIFVIPNASAAFGGSAEAKIGFYALFESGT
jgi:hypothetical protein